MDLLRTWDRTDGEGRRYRVQLCRVAEPFGTIATYAAAGVLAWPAYPSRYSIHTAWLWGAAYVRVVFREVLP